MDVALLVLVTENCKKEAATLGLSLEVERFRARIEQAQSVSYFEDFPHPYIVGKKFGGRQGRLLAEHRTAGEHGVVVFLSLLTRSSRDYAEFAKDPVGYGEKHLKLVSDHDLAAYIRKRTEKDPPPEKQDPSESEYKLLYNLFSPHQGDGFDSERIVLETREWVDQVSQDRFDKQLANLVKACEQCLDRTPTEPELLSVPVPNKASWTIQALSTAEHLVLMRIVTEDTTQADKDELHTQFETLKDGGRDKILRACQRAYPGLVLYDDDLWIDLEKDAQANIALSPEELEILQSIRRPEGNIQFPLFINGRAGSGKSTILQYIYSDILHYYLSNEDCDSIGAPLYLTASKELLDHARRFVEKLLNTDGRYAQTRIQDFRERHKDKLDRSFRQFQRHLLSLIPPEEKGRFQDSKRVDYARFRRLWEDKFGKSPKARKEYGPDLSWHVIRTYIKGRSSEVLLDLDDYDNLPENQKTITSKAYKTVFQQVWTNWYQGHSREYWDDQDLARFILDQGYAKPIHPAIVCDEAQDFTRLELELLLRLNLFSARNVPPADIHRVPFIFAGDQFQTLNPTGFRWDAIKASFVEKFIFELNPALQREEGKIDLNYSELKFNYRSSNNIVCFGNSIQALRSKIFEIPELRPQQAWLDEPDSLPVVFFDSSNGGFWNKYKEGTNYRVIVPCGEDEEAQYVKEDPVLAEQIAFVDGVPVDVLSPVRAKGFEYPAVIVYGFGAALKRYEVHLEKLLVTGEEKSSFIDDWLPLQYFMNRLYVAISRPKRQLIVVDSKDGFERLWKCVDSFERLEQLLESLKNKAQFWAGRLEGMKQGTLHQVGVANTGSPLENAQQYEMDGKASHDSYLMLQAAQVYKRAGKENKALECRARALEFKSDFFEAGEIFLQAGFAEPDALHAFWRAGREGWEQLTREAENQPCWQDKIEFQWAQAIIRGGTREQLTGLLDDFFKRISENDDFLAQCEHDPAWNDGLGELLERLLEVGPSQADSVEFWGRVTVTLDRLKKKFFDVPEQPAAQIYFWAQNYSKAIELWDKAGAPRSSDYAVAKSKVAKYPADLRFLKQAGSHSRIIELYRERPDEKLTAEQAEIVCDALIQAGKEEEAYALAWKEKAAATVFRLCARAHQQDKERAKRTLEAGVVLLVLNNEWASLAKFISSQDNIFVPPIPEFNDHSLKRFVQGEKNRVKAAIVRSLARDPKFEEVQKDTQDKVSSFLWKYLQVKGEQAWNRYCSVEEAGAAIEIAATKILDALAFYEAVIDDKKFSPSDRQFAALRWLVTKKRFGDYLRNNKQTEKATQSENQLNAKMKELGRSSVEGIPTYPELPSIKMPPWLASEPAVIPPVTTSPAVKTEPVVDVPVAPISTAVSSLPANVEFVLDVFCFEFNRNVQRCNVKHQETKDTSAIRVKQGKVTSEDVDFEHKESSVWHSKTWGMTVTLPDAASHDLVIGLEESGLEVRLNTK
jgi:hypothetical protein